MVKFSGLFVIIGLFLIGGAFIMITSGIYDVPHTGTVEGKYVVDNFLAADKYVLVVNENGVITDREVGQGVYVTTDVGETYTWTETIKPNALFALWLTVVGMVLIVGTIFYGRRFF